MDVLTSTEFRKVHGKLTRDTRVTVNGHVIGTWSPARVSKSHTIYVLVDADGRFLDAFLSYSEAMLNKRNGMSIRTIPYREDY